MSYKLGYIDEDAGAKSTFFNFFKDEYDAIKLFEFTEETTVESLIGEIIKEELDLVVIDYELTADGVLDFDADELVEKLLTTYIHFPFIIFTSNENDALDHIHFANKIYSKDIISDNPDFFKKIVKNNMEEYQTKVNTNLEIIKSLTEKKHNEELSIKEEEELSRAFIFLDELDYKDIPSTLVEFHERTNLSNILNEAREIKEILEKIKDGS